MTKYIYIYIYIYAISRLWFFYKIIKIRRGEGIEINYMRIDNYYEDVGTIQFYSNCLFQKKQIYPEQLDDG